MKKTKKKETMKIFKVEAQGDTLYIRANHQSDALRQLEEFSGPIPSSLLTWTEIPKLPKGEELLGNNQ
jgi:hypothetical protein